MKFIRKLGEPSDFSCWKSLGNEDWEPSWSNLRDDRQSNLKPKTTLHQSLIDEQGYICCYCGRRIDRTISHIEHLKPRQLYPELSLDYYNLLASCPGYLEEEDIKALTEAQAPQKHCGQFKDNWYDDKLTVTPLMSDCEDYFRYTAFGEILPTNDLEKKQAAQETIKRLGLNQHALERERRKSIEAILLDIDSLNAEELEKLIYAYEKLDENGKFFRFCAVILYVLRQALRQAS